MKRIVVCCDGTWNAPNRKDGDTPVRTNVQKIFDLILRIDSHGVLQVKHYDEGVGAEGNFFTQLFNGATGKGIDDNIIDSYKFISWNYIPGDQLYLYGFSRGAYTARSLAGMIRKCGILKTNDLNKIKEAYGLYRDQSLHPDSEVLKKFRKEYTYQASVKFIGVWDTVGSLGLPFGILQWYNKKKYQFHDVTLSSSVQYAYHAISVDEQRKNFKPTIWRRSEKQKEQNPGQVLEQRWFPGVHSNVGGGYPDEGLADIALLWMIDRSRDTQLDFDEKLVKEIVKPNVLGKKYNSKAGLFAILPGYVRPVTTDHNDLVIDPSVFEKMRLDKDYRPVNVKMPPQ